MKVLRTAFGVNDDLQEYARDFLYGRTGCLATSTMLRDIGNAQVAVLATDGSFQVELCVLRGGTAIPVHVHPHADTIEVGVAGAVRLNVRGTDPFVFVPDDRLGSFTRRRGIRINHNDEHGGMVLPGGAMFMSIQRWIGVPQSVLTDYCGLPVSPRHAVG